jgi:diguanylate cyclase (GGDEF)-like protein
MELRSYFIIVLRRWWIVAPFFSIALTLSMFLSFQRPMTFQATSTYVTSFDNSVNTVDQTIYALDTVTQRDRLFVTYCAVMTSNAVRERAYSLMNLDPVANKLADYEVRCNVLPQANVIILIVRGPVEAVAQRLNAAIGIAGLERANTLYQYFGLQQLDKPTVENATGSPAQQGILGGVVGLALGVGLAFLLDYLQNPIEKVEMSSIKHPKLGVYNERYFQQRLAEEINRSRSRNRPLSVALVRIIPSEGFDLLPESVRDKALRSAALRMNDAARTTDILAYLGRNTFGLLMPETPGYEAEQFVEKLHNDIRTQTFRVDAYITNFSANSGVVENSGGNLTLQSMLLKANEALQMATQSGENAIHLMRTTPLAFALEPSETAQAPAPEEIDLGFDLDSSNSPFTANELNEILGTNPATNGANDNRPINVDVVPNRGGDR